MKKIRNYLIVIVVFTTSFYSCDEDKLLKENPLDFYAPENSFITSSHFQMAVNNLHYALRQNLYRAGDIGYHYATDFSYNACWYIPPILGGLNDYTNAMVPSAGGPIGVWTAWYGIVKDANVIISRLEYPDCEVSEEEKKIFRSEAFFFRALSYRMLAHLFGGVPLVLEEAASPRRDLTRATRNEVYLQCAEDLEYAAANLSNIDEVKDGKVSKQVSQHLLSEIYISLKEWDKAIQAATAVIDYPACKLMTSRFGSRKDEPGDVYWDLFRLNNQNRSSGNTEGLYVIQYDYQNPGSSSNNMLPWSFNPYYEALSIGGKSLFAGVTDTKCGRSTAWARPTDFYFYTMWGADFDKDIRNSEYNIIRDLQADNPASPYFGKWMVKDNLKGMLGWDSVRNWFPITVKTGRPSNYPPEYYKKNADGSPQKTVYGEILLISAANSSFKDEYLFRLAETYLLRAEAYIGADNQVLAASDINSVRQRANATPISSSEATLHYVLDERMRELALEELRMVTLCRVGKLVERNRMYNPTTGTTILDYHNLWPIPYSEIERNIFGNIEQNPGYSN